MLLRTVYSFPGRLGTPGIGMTAWHQVTGLVAQALDVTLCCGSCDRPVPGLSRVYETMQLGPCPLPYRVMGNDRAFAWHDWLVSRRLRGMLGQVDLVHCWPSGALRTLKVARRHHIPGLLERPSSHTAQAYEVTARECQRLGLQLVRNHYAFWNSKRLAREEAEFALADYLLCPSEFCASTFVERGFSPGRIRLHQYGYAPATFSPPSCGERASDRSFSLVFVGECFPLKGLHFALDAWLQSGAADRGKFYICGRFMPEYRQLLADKLSHPSIEVVGFTSDVANVMRRADALVLPSFSEGSALVTYEARACGLVLIVSDAAGARCEHMHNGLVHRAGDASMLRMHIQTLARDPELLARLRAASIAGLADLTWARAGERLVEAYEGAVGARLTEPATVQLGKRVQ